MHGETIGNERFSKRHAMLKQPFGSISVGGRRFNSPKAITNKVSIRAISLLLGCAALHLVISLVSASDIDKRLIVRKAIAAAKLIGENLKPDECRVKVSDGGFVSVIHVNVICVFKSPDLTLTSISNGRFMESRMKNGPKLGSKFATDAEWFHEADIWLQKLWPGASGAHDRVQRTGVKASPTGYWSNSNVTAVRMYHRSSQSSVRFICIEMDSATGRLLYAQFSDPFPITVAKKRDPDSKYLKSLH